MKEKPHLFLWLAEVLRYWATGEQKPETEVFLIESLFRDFLMRDKVIILREGVGSNGHIAHAVLSSGEGVFVDFLGVSTPQKLAHHLSDGTLVLNVDCFPCSELLDALYDAIWAEVKDPSYISPSALAAV